jgi:YVTN family beta-propeller protein
MNTIARNRNVLSLRIWAVPLLYALGGLLLALPARASHAYALACCSVPSSVSVNNRATHQIAGTLISGQGAAFVALSPDGQTAYVANENDSTISALDTATGVPVASISLSAFGANPWGAVVSQDGTFLYVTAVQNGFVSVLGIDTTDNSIQFDVQTTGTYGTDLSPIPLPPPVISSDGQNIYILASELIIFDVTSVAWKAITLPSGISHPQGIAVTPDGAYAMLTFNEGDRFNQNAGQFALVELSTGAVAQEIGYASRQTVGSVASSPDGSFAYFPLNSSGEVSVAVFDISRRHIVNTFPAGSGTGTAIAITPDGGDIELGEANECSR